jgi:hypothetical protein
MDIGGEADRRHQGLTIPMGFDCKCRPAVHSRKLDLDRLITEIIVAYAPI